MFSLQQKTDISSKSGRIAAAAKNDLACDKWQKK